MPTRGQLFLLHLVILHTVLRTNLSNTLFLHLLNKSKHSKHGRADVTHNANLECKQCFVLSQKM